MTQSIQPLPTLGQPNATEDAKVRSLLTELQGIVNGNVDASNLAAGAVGAAALATAAVTSAKLSPTINLSNAANHTSTAGVAYTDVTSLTFTPAVAGRSLFVAVTQGTLTVNGGTGYVNTKLVVDGTDQANFSVSSGSYTGTANQVFYPYTNVGIWIPTLTAGSHTVTTYVGCPSGGSASITYAALLRVELGS